MKYEFNIIAWIGTYNHQDYIRQAIDGIMMQKTNFVVKLLISEDCSKDKTLEICEEYRDKYPDVIELIIAPKNTSGMIRKDAYIRLFNDGVKYIAMCEGDDYWTDPHKLQKQVDFLEANPEFSMCSHKVEWLEDGIIQSFPYGPPIKDRYTLDDVLANPTFLHTCSLVFRSSYIDVLPAWFYDCSIGDFPLIALMAQYGDIGFINENMAVYRRHEKGIHGGATRIQNLEDGIQTRILVGKKMGLIGRISLRSSLTEYYKNLSSEYIKIKDFKNARKSAWRRLHYSQKGQRIISLRRLIELYVSSSLISC